MESAKIDELPIEVCKDKATFVEYYLKPLLRAAKPSIADVLYDYYFNGDSAIDEVVQVHYNGGSSLSINVSRDSKMQLVDDVMRGLGGNDKVSVASTLKDFIKVLKQGEPGNDVRIFFPKSWREDIEFGIERIEHNVGGFAETDIILKKV